MRIDSSKSPLHKTRKLLKFSMVETNMIQTILLFDDPKFNLVYPNLVFHLLSEFKLPWGIVK